MPDQVGVPVVMPHGVDDPTVPDPLTVDEPPVKYATAAPVMASTPMNATTARRFLDSIPRISCPTFVVWAHGEAGPN